LLSKKENPQEKDEKIGRFKIKFQTPIVGMTQRAFGTKVRKLTKKKGPAVSPPFSFSFYSVV